MTTARAQAIVESGSYDPNKVSQTLALFDKNGKSIDLTQLMAPLTPNIVFDGDSQSIIGVAAPLSATEYGDTFPALVSSGMDPRATLANIAVSGQTVAGMAANAAVNVDTRLIASARNIVVFWAGTNDLWQAATATVVYDRIVSYHRARREVGWKTVVFTIMSRTDVNTPIGYEAARVAVNTSIRANWASFADALCDIDLDTRLQNSANATYFADLVHCNLTGRHVAAGHAKKALGVLGVRVINNPQLLGLVSPAASKGFVSIGEASLGVVTTAVDCTAYGRYCLANVTTGSQNVGVGRSAGGAITIGAQNVVVGTYAANATTSGNNNVVLGMYALYLNTTGSESTVVGALAAFSATAGSITAFGYRAAYAPGGLTTNATTTGLRQTNVGYETGQSSAIQRNDTTSVGYRALVGENDASSFGSGAQALHLSSVALGKGSITTAANQVMVGARDVEITDTTKGVVLRSPDGTRYRITVANGGALTAVAVV